MKKPTITDNTEEDTAIDDRAFSLSTLRARAGKPLHYVVLDIYDCFRKGNEKSTKFLDNLKCFLPERTGHKRYPYNYDRQASSDTILLEPHVNPQRYVAVSYPWSVSYGESSIRRKYKLQGETVPVRDVVLDRTIRFIREKERGRKMIPFWIDQLSLNRNDDLEHKLGMQSMDRVYKECEYAVGYLWAKISTQAQINLLANLLKGKIAKEVPDGQFPILREDIDAQMADDILDLLTQIMDDQWWSRAWIFQEDYLAGTKMWLLIRHTQGLNKSFAQEELGTLSCELVVKSEEFRKYATLFCLALQRKIDPSTFASVTCSKILRKAGQYKTIHKYKANLDKAPAMTIDILTELNERGITVPSDFLAITANVCDYDVRVIPKKNDTSRMSLSMGIVTLCISNGEMIGSQSEIAVPYGNIFDFLRDDALNISAPLVDGALTFSKHCRLSVDHLSLAGIHTKGVLWKLSDPIRPSSFRKLPLYDRKRSNQRDVFRNGLNEHHRSRLIELVRVLSQRNMERYSLLVNDLLRYLQNRERTVTSNDWPSTFVMDEMAVYIVDAMDTGKYIQVASRVQGREERPDMRYRALFVRDRHEIQRSGSSYIFTSWTGTKEELRNEVKLKRPAKYVSVEVILNGIAECGAVSLRSRRWTNGLCFFSGEMKSAFVFTWPRLLCE